MFRKRPPQAQGRGADGRSSIRILVADDDSPMRALLAAAIERDGFEAVEARDAAEALRVLRDAQSGAVPPINLLVSDVRMPGGTGLELLERLRQIDCAVRVILITAFGSEAVHEEGLRLGASVVLDKPFRLDALLTEVRKCLGLPPSPTVRVATAVNGVATSSDEAS